MAYILPKWADAKYGFVRDLFAKPAMHKILPDLPKGRKPLQTADSLYAKDDRPELERDPPLPGVQVREGL